jgi:hypothetical protein
MSSPFVAKVGQRIRVKPSANPHSLTKEIEHLVGVVVEMERDYAFRTLPNGKKQVESRYSIPPENLGAIVVFGNSPERYRIPLAELMPA